MNKYCFFILTSFNKRSQNFFQKTKTNKQPIVSGVGCVPQAFHVGMAAGILVVPFSILLPANAPETIQVLGPPSFVWETKIELPALALAWTRPGCYGHMGTKPGNE